MPYLSEVIAVIVIFFSVELYAYNHQSPCALDFKKRVHWYGVCICVSELL